MIEIPSGASPPPVPTSSPATTSASTGSTALDAAASIATDSAKAAVQAKLEAVVQQVQARNPVGLPDRQSWDLLLRLNPQASGTPVLANELTPEVMRNLQAGQGVLLLTRTTQPLPVDTRLQVLVSPAQGVQIQQLQAPALPPATLAQLKQFIHQQQPLAPLLSNLLHLLQPGQQNQLAALPLRVQAAIAQVVATLPVPGPVPGLAQDQPPNQLKNWIENSGLLQEAKLAQWLKDAVRLTEAGSRDGGNLRSPGNAQTPNHPAGQTLAQMRQQVQQWVQRLQAGGNGGAGTGESDSHNGGKLPEAGASIGRLLQQDLKHQLQQLERQLRQTQGPATGEKPARTPVSPQTAEAGATTAQSALTKPAQPDVAGKPGAAVLPASGATTDAEALTPDKVALRKSGQPGSAAEVLSRTASSSAQPPARPPLPIQRYQAGSAQIQPRTGGDGPVPDLIPPLPGQVVVQAQARARPSLKDNDLTDAIVKTLLAQVRGALARVTLHQLSSQSARQEGAAPTTLSFEIPFLQHGQVEVFQFRIDEETPRPEERREKNQAKRWVVQMGFDIEGLGPMFCQLSLTGKSMAVQFWAAWEQTLNSTKAHFSFLENSLQEMGIRVEKIQAQLGMPDVDRTGIRNQLVDIKT